MRKIGTITLLVNDVKEAVDFYTGKLGFEKRMEQQIGGNAWWITVAPRDQKELEIVFVPADTPEKKARVGSQVADHVLFVIETDDITRDYAVMKEKGVNFFGEPITRFYGTEVVFEDLYGNRIDLIELPRRTKS